MGEGKAGISGSASLQQQIIQVLYRKAGAEGYSLADQADEILSLVAANEAPDGWFHLGSHVEWDGQLEFSEALGEDGLPLWERPLPLASAAAKPRSQELPLFGVEYI